MTLKPVAVIAALLVAALGCGRINETVNARGGENTLRRVTNSVVSPINNCVRSVGDGFSGMGRKFASRKKLEARNARLEKENKELKAEIAASRSMDEENKRLRKLLNAKPTVGGKCKTGEIIARDPSNWFDTATVNLGQKDGVETGAAVVSDKGLIGQISSVTASSGKIVYLTDSGSNIGAMTERSRAPGILQGAGTDELVLNYLAKDADIRQGDAVITSGMGGVIPKGIPVGVVTKIKRDNAAGITVADVRPAVDFDELEFVFVTVK
ncbi:MAG: rod shape-determining protein MreC [Abditibacteriota bacterium]|nr:rod shape-determining protein MreC [Abditibacteriota bacterium]